MCQILATPIQAGAELPLRPMRVYGIRLRLQTESNFEIWPCSTPGGKNNRKRSFGNDRRKVRFKYP